MSTIELLTTIFFLGEEETDGHHPMRFDCSDGNLYYCKYLINQTNQKELDFLAYEIIANQLLKALKVSTPDIALIQLTKDSFDKQEIVHNKKIKLGNPVLFGSKEVRGSSLVSGVQLFCRKKEINRYSNHFDLIRIATFDLLVDNKDRGRSDNMNLLEAEYVHEGKKKIKFYAIDHAFIFGGQNNLRFFKPENSIETAGKFVDNIYFRNYIKLIPKKIRLQVLEDFIILYKEVYNETLHNTFAMFHSSWNIPPNLNDRVLNYLSNEQRLNAVYDKMYQLLKTA